MAYTDYKFVLILNKKIEIGKVINAAAHMTAGLLAKASAEDKTNMQFLDFIDKDGGLHPSVSANSLIVLRAKSGEIRKVRKEAMQRGILSVDFTETMTGDTYVEQLKRTKQTPEVELIYYGICLFGKKSALDEFTRKYSLWM